MVKNLPANAGDPGSIPGSRRSPGEEDDNSLHSVAHQRSLVGHSPWGQQRVRHDWATKHTCTQARRTGSSCSKDSNSLIVFRGRCLGKEILKWVLKCVVNRVMFQECQSSTFWWFQAVWLYMPEDSMSSPAFTWRRVGGLIFCWTTQRYVSDVTYIPSEGTRSPVSLLFSSLTA